MNPEQADQVGATDSPELPPGFVVVPVRTTHLEMLANAAPAVPETPPQCEVSRWVRPPLDEYRALFTSVGGPWGWAGRLLLGDDELAAIVGDDRIEIWRLEVESDVAGFVELDRRVPGEVEIVYFGLTPEFIGRGLGGFLLRWAINHAWTTPDLDPGAARMRRLWLHTCDYDHPAALSVYVKAGFRVYCEHAGLEAYPQAHIARLARGPDTEARLVQD
jgi:GNAT superfamily N-acetyltransferase